MAPSNSDSSTPGPLEFFLFAGWDGRFVAHNIFLDGNTFRSGPEINIQRDDFVIDFRAGATFRYKAWQFSYTYVKRSEEFEPPSGRADGTHRFGSIALSYNIWQP